MIVFDFMLLEIISVKSDDGIMIYEEFDDWNMIGVGIEIVEGGVIFVVMLIKVIYKFVIVDVIEVLINSGKMFECFFEGENVVGIQCCIQVCYFWCCLNLLS